MPQDVGQTFQHVDADRAGACRVIARQRVVLRRHFGHVRDRDQTWGRRLGEFLQAIPQGPQHQPQPGRGRLQKERQEDGELAEAHAVFAECTASLLVQFFHVAGHRVARQDAHRLGQTEGKAAREAGKCFVPAHGQKGLELGGNLAVDEMLQPAANLFHDFRPGLVVDKSLDQWLRGLRPLDQLADGRVAPHKAALLGKVQLGVGCVVEAVRPQVELRLQGLDRGLRQRARGIG